MRIAPAQYNANDENQYRANVRRELERRHSKEGDVEIQEGQRVILRSPDGSRWAIQVSDAGALSAAAVS